MNDINTLVSSLVAESCRLDFLPSKLGTRLMMRGETLIYAWMSKLCKTYKGAYWHFYTLSNGGFYMAPELDRLWLEVYGNEFSGVMSADAAGIVATLFMIGQLTAENEGKPEVDALIDHYHFLREFADTHEESALIFQAID